MFDSLLLLLILAGAFFGLVPFLAPAPFAAATGFAGTDVFMYRLAGAATFGYAVGLLATVLPARNDPRRQQLDRTWRPAS